MIEPFANPSTECAVLVPSASDGGLIRFDYLLHLGNHQTPQEPST